MKKEIYRQIDKLGRWVIPADLRKIYDFKAGDTLYFSAQDNGILIHSEGSGSVQENDKK